ncbi:MAG: hypothetical protein GY830_08140 [Bacteroidetes bacterium]|nr:hypothetical protein [Bacteroidota bacterium]
MRNFKLILLVNLFVFFGCRNSPNEDEDLIVNKNNSKPKDEKNQKQNPGNDLNIDKNERDIINDNSLNLNIDEPTNENEDIIENNRHC